VRSEAGELLLEVVESMVDDLVQRVSS
jgi:hypothetical protein